MKRISDWLLPLCIFLLALGLWEALVRINQVPHYVLPAPSLIAKTMVDDWAMLSSAMLVTLRITFQALLAAVIGGVALEIGRAHV